MTPIYTWYSSLHGFSLELPLRCILDCSHSGQCDADVSAWLPQIDFSAVPRASLVGELRETGGWEREELEQASDETLRSRVLWLACCDSREELRDELRREVSAYSEQLGEYDPADIADDEGGPSGDLRVQWLDGSMHIHTGDAQYDTNHRGVWASAIVEPDMHVSDVCTLVSELLEELADAEAEADDEAAV